MEIQHVIHHHPLSLLFIDEWNTIKYCKGCYNKLSGPAYGCKTCRFETDVECALKPIIEYSDECTIQHFTHAHPLKLVDSNQKDEVICPICQELCSSSSSSTYGCMECEFFLHKSCMKSIPRQLINHHIHPCTLIFITDPYGRDECACCGEHIVPGGMKFSCGACEFDLHVKCALFPTIDSEDAKEIQHFSHPHTLALVQNDEEYGSEPHCVACAQICLAPALTFRCSRSCDHFFLHKSCYVKLPYNSINFKHPFHPKHPLTIKSLPYNDHIRTCDACCRGIDTTLLAYSCWESECKFNLHLDCYKLLPSITFSGHQHFLTLYEKTADVSCHLCGVNCRNIILQCVPCDINIHFQCHPSTPKTIKHKSHLHPLTLTKSPFEYELNSDEEEEEFYCDVYEQKRNRRELIYYCKECKFIAELKCVFSVVLSLFLEDNSSEKENLKDDVAEVYPEIQKWQVGSLLLKRIRLHEGQLLLEAKMKQLKGESDGVKKEIQRTEDMLGNLVRGSSKLLGQLVENNSQLRDLFNGAKNQGLKMKLD
ncbi:hypothetical protein J1N35_042622 [Gossypium stocksii]|uniref:Phorbol-ester/DAG-type domain-containing protein n=1 Tax=Gossypium stocksii TaxID=47602 RepID=A0A9D3U5W6_9ROSI|nr:hypothetical protein J1N35_042622 [Gossypium stocksii]